MLTKIHWAILSFRTFRFCAQYASHLKRDYNLRKNSFEELASLQHVFLSRHAQQ